MLKTVKNELADVSSVSPSSKQLIIKQVYVMFVLYVSMFSHERNILITKAISKTVTLRAESPYSPL